MRKHKERETSRVGKRGTIVIPAKLRKRFGFEEGTFVIAEERGDGVFIRPAVVVPIEIYTKERIAEFLLTNSMDMEEYAEVVEEVEAMGLDPENIPHRKPE